MPDSGAELAIEACDGLAEIAAADWDACAGPDNPFLAHAFLGALETAGCVGARTGWTARHLLARDATGFSNPAPWAALERKGLIRSMFPRAAVLTAEGQAYDTGLREEILHRSGH